MWMCNPIQLPDDTVSYKHDISVMPVVGKFSPLIAELCTHAPNLDLKYEKSFNITKQLETTIQNSSPHLIHTVLNVQPD